MLNCWYTSSLSSSPGASDFDLNLEQNFEQRHADVQPVPRLPKVRRPRIGVHLRGDLIQPRQARNGLYVRMALLKVLLKV